MLHDALLGVLLSPMLPSASGIEWRQVVLSSRSVTEAERQFMADCTHWACHLKAGCGKIVAATTARVGQVRTLTTSGWAMRLQRIARSYSFSNEEDW